MLLLPATSHIWAEKNPRFVESKEAVKQINQHSYKPRDIRMIARVLSRPDERDRSRIKIHEDSQFEMWQSSLRPEKSSRLSSLIHRNLKS